MSAGGSQTRNIAVFLDRDGVLIEDGHLRDAFLTHPDQVRLLPGAAQAVRRLNDSGLFAIVVTNQSAIARGIISEAELGSIHARMTDLLQAQAGARLDRIYSCPYHPDGTVARYARDSNTRKPRPGMLLEAARDFELDLPGCFLVGDQERDILAAKRVQCTAVAVATQPHGVTWRSWSEGIPDSVAPDLAAAVDWILDF